MTALDISELARLAGSWRGALGVDEFDRLGAVVGNRDAVVDVRLDFAIDDAGHPRASGTARVTANVLCTRCLRLAAVDVESSIDLRVVGSEAQARLLTPTFDTVVAADGRLPVTALIEDDLLLSLPEAACVDRATCPHAPSRQRGSAAASDGSRGASPFAALEALKPGFGESDDPGSG